MKKMNASNWLLWEKIDFHTVHDSDVFFVFFFQYHIYDSFYAVESNEPITFAFVNIVNCFNATINIAVTITEIENVSFLFELINERFLISN